MDHFHGLLEVPSSGIMKTWQGSGEDREHVKQERRKRGKVSSFIGSSTHLFGGVTAPRPRWKPPL